MYDNDKKNESNEQKDNQQKNRDSLKKDCIIFANGHWTKNRPQKLGLFPTMTNQKETSKALHIFWNPIKEQYMDELQIMQESFCNYENTGWAGYWWSEPYPDPSQY